MLLLRDFRPRGSVSRTKWALTVQAASIRSFQSLHARNEKLAGASAALAGGAMHEMATPLSTIALVAKELQYTLQHTTQDADLSNRRTLLTEDTIYRIKHARF